MPDKSMTNILEENWSAEKTPRIPQPGDRTRAYKYSDSSDNITHAREGDWVVTRVERFASFDTDNRIAVCYCKYDPIEPQWEVDVSWVVRVALPGDIEVRRGASANELLEVMQV